jgi:hypothetical protein
MNEELKKLLGEWLDQFVNSIFTHSQENLVRPMPYENRARNLPPSVITDTGGLLRSGTVSVDKENLTASIMYDNPQAAIIEFGCDPHMPPKEPLKRWAMRKLGMSEKKAEKFAEKLAWEIYHHGQDPHPFMRPAVDQTVNETNKI